jgi:hypothetical protein
MIAGVERTYVHFSKRFADRIDIPKSAIDRISELMSPGSSIIVSDQGISKETGNDTDFIVLVPS